MKVRIVNDGELAYNSKVLDAETGQMVTLIKRVIIDFDVDNPIASAMLFMHGDVERWKLHGTHTYPRVNIVAETEIKMICPYCGNEVKKE